MRLGLALIVITLAFSPFLKSQKVKAAPSPAVGIACTYGPTFNLTADSGNIILPDGYTMFMWSYIPTSGTFQYPGPVLCVNEGDTVTVILQNQLPEATSIMFPGQEDVLANGVPAQPEFDGSNNLVSLTPSAPAGGSITYSFVASKPGTYIYESGTDPKKQVAMGLASVLIVRPVMGAGFAYNRADSQFTPEEEFLALLSEVDPYLHEAVEVGDSYDMNNYQPRYWLLNGRGFPDTIADNNAPWLPYQPYGALALIHPYDASTHPYPGIERFVNVGTEDFPFHPHGNNGLVIGRDGNPLEGPAGQDLSFEKFAINIGPGQTWDVLFKWYDAEGYSEANPVPVTIPDVANQTFGMFYSGSPYLGVMGTMPPGMSTLNQCGEYYIISHNHALFQLNAWDMTMGGQITYLRVDPPAGCP
jgi:FtsP/CotA-like multicopper oxidase with cupredoxin domain